MEASSTHGFCKPLFCKSYFYIPMAHPNLNYMDLLQNK
jgi:hypothetical protein